MRLFRRSLALVIGINNYHDGLGMLTNAVNDATVFAELLRNRHHYDHVRLLTDDAATVSAIRAVIEDDLAREIGPQDRLLIYFAGHGIIVPEVAEDGGPIGYILPQEARPDDVSTYLSMRELYQLLAQLPCRHLLLVLDCCFAAAFLWAAGRNLRPAPKLLYQERFARFVADPAWQVLTSANDRQQANDIFGSRGEHAHSPFAAALFDALNGAADLPAPGQKAGDGIITATELYWYLRHEVERRTANHYLQTPGLGPMRKHRGGEYVFLVGPTSDLPKRPPLSPENNPYRGLLPFEEHQRPLFFGREDAIARLTAHVIEHPLTVVLGASGAGKSSLVRAGLLPDLRASTHWELTAPFRPSTSPDPFEALCEVFPIPTGRSLAEQVGAWTSANPGKRLLLVIDQFEELITDCPDLQTRYAFQQALADALEHHPKTLRIVLTLRSDFEPLFRKEEPHGRQEGPLNKHWQRWIVNPMTVSELRDAVLGPADECMLVFEPPKLADDLVEEVLGMPGALPLLSFTLEQLYISCMERGEDRALRAEDYQAIGSVTAALGKTVDRVYQSLGGAQQMTMRRILLRMVTLEGGEPARRRVHHNELVYDDPATNQRVAEVCNALIAARLIVQDKDGQHLEPAHDALIQSWPMLTLWLNENEQKSLLLLHRQTTGRAERWDRDGRSNNLLDRGRQVEALEEADRTGRIMLNRLEGMFVRKSLARERAQRNRVVVVSLVLTVVFALIAAYALAQQQLAVNEANQRATAQALAQNEANQRATEVVVRQTAQAEAEAQALRSSRLADSAIAARESAEAQLRLREAEEIADWLDDEELSVEARLLLAVQSTARADTVEAGLALRTLLDRYPWSFRVAPAPPQPLFGPVDFGAPSTPEQRPLVFSSGDTYLLATYNNDLVLWDVAQAAHVRTFSSAGIGVSVASFLQRDGFFVTGDQKGALHVWNTTTGKRVSPLEGHTAEVTLLSSSGTTLLSAAADGTAQIQTVGVGRLRQLPNAGTFAVAATFGRGGTRAVLLDSASTGDGAVRFYDTSSGALIGQSSGATFNRIAVGPDDTTLLAFSPSRIELFDIQQGRSLRVIRPTEGTFAEATFVNNGRQIRTRRANSTVVQLWSSATGQESARPAPAPDTSTVYDPTQGDQDYDVRSWIAGKQAIATSDWDGRLRFWYPASGQRWGSLEVAQRSGVIVFHPDSRSLLLTQGREVQHREVGSSALLLSFTKHISPVTALGISADGLRAFSASADAVYAWSVKDGQVLAHIDIGGRSTPAAAISPDGSLLAVSLARGIRLISLDGKPDRMIQGSVDTLVFTTDSQHLVVRFLESVNKIDLEGKRLVRLQPSKQTTVVRPSNNVIFSIATGGFGDNQILATTESDNNIYLWSLTTGDLIGKLVGHTDTPLDLQFSASGALLLSTGLDDRLLVWDVAKQQIRTRLGEMLFHSAALSADGRLAATHPRRDRIEVLLVSHADLRNTAACQIGRILLPDERRRYGLAPNTPDYVLPVTLAPLPTQGCAPALPPAGSRIVSADPPEQGPEQRVKDFVRLLSTALNDPDIVTPDRQREWAERMLEFAPPQQRAGASFANTDLSALTALVRLNVGAWIGRPELDVRLQITFDVRETRLVSQANDRAVVEIVDGIGTLTVTGDDATALGDYSRMVSLMQPLSESLRRNSDGPFLVNLERVEGVWYLSESLQQ